MIKIACTLLIDDDLINNFINERLIKNTGISREVKSVSNGKLALKYIEEYRLLHQDCCPELIFLDINMPVMDGFEFLDAFRKLIFANHSRVKIVVLSTSSHQRDLNNAMAHGIELFINKPLTREKIENFYYEHFPQTGTGN
jgi:CheY-like chemotaxis protein